MRYKLYLLIIALQIIISCDSPSNKKTTVESKPKKVEKKNGLIVNKRQDGSLLSEINYKDGVKEGVAKNYFRNNKVQHEFYHVNNKQHGETKSYYEDGALYKTENFKNGIKEGLTKIYNPDGNLHAEYSYRNGFAGKGLKEYNKKGKILTDYPSIKVEEIDELLKKNKYTFKFSLSKIDKRAKFYIGVLKDGYLHDGLYLLFNNDGYATYTYTLPPGFEQMEKLSIVVETKSKFGNPVVLSYAKNVYIQNK